MRKTNIILIGCLCLACFCHAKDYNILDFGACNDTSVLSTMAIQQAIDICSADGGGRVIVPSGDFKTGTLILKNSVELSLENGARLWGSRKINDYPAIQPRYISLRTQGITKQLIYAEDAHHISITGFGEINGQGSSFVRKGKNEEGIRRPHLLRFISCHDIVVENVTLKNSGAWMEHYLACEHVQIKGISIYNHNNYNNDGIDLDGCKNVTVSNIICDSDDDGITLKSTSPKLCENIAIVNCIVSSHCNAIKMGTESNGGFRNITISNCVIKPSEHVNEKSEKSKFFGQYTGITGISLEIVDGGIMEGISISNIRIDGTYSPIFIRLGNRARPYREGMNVSHVGSIRNVAINGVIINTEEKIGCSVTGLPGFPVENIHLSNIFFQAGGGGKKEDVYKDIPEKEKDYPEGTMFGDLPASGFFIRHVKNISLTGCEFTTAKPDARPALYMNDVINSKFTDLTIGSNTASEAAIWLNQVHDVVVKDCLLRGMPQSFIRAEGNETSAVFITGNILTYSRQVVTADPKVKKVVVESGNIRQKN